ncbi:MAG: universal stress protein [Deltaproteobacteria bacterium]|nr:universal stress protein [Deltaproteobacteria bacterium]
MKNVLVVISAADSSDKAVEFAVLAAKKEGGTVFALYMLEGGSASDVSERFTDMGFIGDKPSTEVSEAIMKEYRQRGYEELGRVQIKCMEEGVPFEPLMEAGEEGAGGDFVARVLDCIASRAIGLAVVVRSKKKTLARYLTKPPEDRLKEAAPCRVEVFD